MFLKQSVGISRRGFIPKLAGGIVLAALGMKTLCRQAIAEARLEGKLETVNGTSMFRITTIMTHTNVGGVPLVQRLIDNGSWVTLPPTNYIVTPERTELVVRVEKNRKVLFRFAIATIKVSNLTHRIALLNGGTLFDAMMNLASSVQSFTFSSKPFEGLGQFITGIKGTDQGGDKKWMLYVNDVQSQKGCSQLVLKPGDQVEWRYE